MSERIYSVSYVLAYLKNKLSSEYNLNNINVEGEIGNFTNHSSGHWYFTLKDNAALINCAMFRFNNQKVRFLPKNGDKVVIKGNVTLFEKSGQLQILVSDMKLSGSGDFYQQFELMKKKLAPLGYFDEARKKKFKSYPEQISIVTGANTAALQDILITINKRWPVVKTILHPAIVQGNEAVESVVNALRLADSDSSDAVILARGGGSVDDLFCFNDEKIAVCLFNMKTPVVTGIGHEIDFTIADLVADRRAATPTAAAQSVTPDCLQVRENLISIENSISTAVENRIASYNQLLDYCNVSLSGYRNNLINTSKQIQMNRQNLSVSLNSMISSEKQKKFNCMSDIRNRLNLKLMNTENMLNIENRAVLSSFRHVLTISSNRIQTNETALRNSFKDYLNRKEFSFNNMMNLLDSYSPLKTLKRGYSLVYSRDNLISSIDQIKENDKVRIRLYDGLFDATVNGKE